MWYVRHRGRLVTERRRWAESRAWANGPRSPDMVLAAAKSAMENGVPLAGIASRTRPRHFLGLRRRGGGGRRDNSTNVGTRRRRGVRVAVVVGGVDSEASGSAKSAPHSAMTPMPSKTCLSTTLLFRVSSTLRLAALACCKPVNRGSHSPPSDHRRLLSPSPSHRPHELCLCLPGRSALLRRRRTAVASSSAARSRPRIWDGIFRVRQPQPSN